MGGWKLTSIFRWNSGLPVGSPSDGNGWSTNLQLTSLTEAVLPVHPCVSRATAQFFACNNTFAYQDFRNSYPGEIGQRNFYRQPGYIDLDAGLYKGFKLDRAHLGEKTELQLRWDVFNTTNTQEFGPCCTGYQKRSPTTLNPMPPGRFATFTSIQGTPRVMQVGLRLEF